MAGTLKPSDNLRKELVLYEDVIINDYKLSNGTSPLGLFDGNISPDWNTTNVSYFCKGYNDWLDITFLKSCRLWRYPSTGYPQYSGEWTIEKYENNNWVDVSDKLDQTKLIPRSEWSVAIDELPKGRYRFTITNNNTSSRLDSEWYVEYIPHSYCLSNKSNLFIPNQNYYNTETMQYESISQIPENIKDIDCNDLLDTPDYLNGDRVIDKFNGDIQIINPDYESGDILTLNGIKSTRELVIASGDINNGVAQTINSIMIESTKSGNASIKLALSIDSGNTWKTHDGTDWQDLSINIPKTTYNTLSQSELSSWNNAKDVIYSNGIDVSIFNSLDFNSLTDTSIAPNTIRFAYVLDRPSYTDNVSTTKMTWNFNAKGSMKKMKETEYELDMFEHQIKFTSLIENSMIITNIII